MTINLITLATVKTQLGIAVTTYDPALTALIPIVSADVRWIMNHDYADYTVATIASGSDAVTCSINLSVGDVLQGTGITADTYISGYDEESAEYTMSANSTEAVTSFVRTINIRQWPAISKMIEYRRTKQLQSVVGEKGIASEGFGPVSTTYTAAEINSRYDYPQKLINDLGTPYARVT